MGHKYPLLKPGEIIAALSKKGFVYKSQKGSHVKYAHEHRRVVIPLHETVACSRIHILVDS